MRTWDFGTRDEGLGDIKYGTRNVKYRDAGDVNNYCKPELNAISLSS